MISNHLPGTLQSILPTVGPAILVSIGYVDPGKWAAIIDGGARFGIDLLIPMLIFNVGAILCQYLAAKLGVVTGKDLAQVFSYSFLSLSFLCKPFDIILSLAVILATRLSVLILNYIF